MNDIRHIATTFNSQVIALAEFQKRVQIFDIKNSQVISEFDTVLDFGGDRLAISEDGQICICGCWARYGICAYETATGKLIWQRKDLKKVQHIQTLHADKTKLFAYFEIGASRVIDIKTGEDVGRLIDARYLFNSRYLPLDVVNKSDKIQITERETGKIKANIGMQSFATLDLDIADGCFAVSESAGPLSCYDMLTGQLKWRIPENEDGHFLRVSFNSELELFVGITWPYVNGGKKKLKYINKETGAIENEVAINCPVITEFALDGQVLITSDREIIDIKSGNKKNWTLPHHKSEYSVPNLKDATTIQ